MIKLQLTFRLDNVTDFLHDLSTPFAHFDHFARDMIDQRLTIFIVNVK